MIINDPTPGEDDSMRRARTLRTACLLTTLALAGLAGCEGGSETKNAAPPDPAVGQAQNQAREAFQKEQGGKTKVNPNPSGSGSTPKP
jgi:ABC-type glycerol-3-phosphate transport system substrate-binding protein